MASCPSRSSPIFIPFKSFYTINCLTKKFKNISIVCCFTQSQDIPITYGVVVDETVEVYAAGFFDRVAGEGSGERRAVCAVEVVIHTGFRHVFLAAEHKARRVGNIVFQFAERFVIYEFFNPSAGDPIIREPFNPHVLIRVGGVYITVVPQNHVRISTRFRLILHNKVYHKYHTTSSP